MYNTTLLEIITHAVKQHPELIGTLIETYRESISHNFAKSFDDTVSYGIFKGLHLGDSHWGRADRASMVLGLYETEILCNLATLAGRFKTFIDLGAANGYYGIGVVKSEIFEKSYCFEINEDSQNIIRQNAILNNVENKIIIHGAADKKFYQQINPSDLKSSVLFVDIEGHEFDLFDTHIFEIFSSSVIFIELHDWFFDDGEAKLNKLQKDSKHTHSWTTFHTGSRDPSKFQELASYPDTFRWLLCSEGRGRLMSWARLDPII